MGRMVERPERQLRNVGSETARACPVAMRDVRDLRETACCLFIWFVWLTEINQMNKTNQMNQINPLICAAWPYRSLRG